MSIRQKISKKHIISFLGVGLIIFLQNYFIVMSHDDFGYGSLSYGAEHPGFPHFNFEHNQYSLFDILTYLKWHYFGWGGRVISYFFLISFLKFDLIFFKITQSIIVFSVLIMLARINKKEKEPFDVKILIISSSMYGLISLEIMRESVFWPSASVGYLWTSVLAIFLIHFWLKDEPVTVIKKAIFIILFFIGGCSQEQVGLAIVSFMLMSTIVQLFIKKKIRLENIFYVLSSIIGFVILIISPGNKLRISHSSSGDFFKTPFVERTITRLGQQIDLLFNEKMILFIAIFLFSLMLISLKNTKSRQGNSLLNLTMPFAYMFSIIMYSYVVLRTNSDIQKALFCFLIIMTSYTLFVDLLENKNPCYISLFVGILASHFSLIVALPTGNRTLFPTIILIIVFSIYVLRLVNYNLNKGIISVLLLAALLNTSYIVLGYYNNYSIHMYNHNKLKKYSEISIDQDIININLKKFDVRFSDSAPWVFVYQKWWIKKYYLLPLQVEIKYE
ncbi:hypothetical protein HRM2_29890 [Desulforapulum autotrophicum HRM2]|uniref:Glycosyltransferase RgtA/B/C/D-like domain-containing protein n=1 Tax=Desulforapulum autotrophicum (strain ATCC 43914 / DSM 3382 / VKM B-1955 / HRM2) TaxID=177437 RepID=C0QK46_DESAH|nr:DUF6056 family protein [Desulforapulum autotrophicum]ACN16072.1 hypothetical protein HRM2_29890 [Desulforapulum autotrophicum HRM2]